MDELVIKVPAPFSGIEDLGFSARYPAQERSEPLRDIPLFVEGPAGPMHLLVERLALFSDKDRIVGSAADDDQYSWTAPVQLTDQVCVLAFQDRSMRAGELAPRVCGNRTGGSRLHLEPRAPHGLHVPPRLRPHRRPAPLGTASPW